MKAQRLYRLYLYLAMLLGLLFLPVYLRELALSSDTLLASLDLLFALTAFPVAFMLFVYVLVWSVRLFSTGSDTLRARIAAWLSMLFFYPLTELVFSFGSIFWLRVLPVILLMLIILPLNWCEFHPLRKRRVS